MTTTADRQTWELIAAAVPRHTRVLAPDAPGALVELLAGRDCDVVTAATHDGATEVEVAILPRVLDQVDDPRQAIKDLSGRLQPTGMLLVVAPSTWHAALRIALGEPGAPDALARAAAIAWPATLELLEELDLHVWFDLPVHGGVLDGTGIDPRSVTAEVVDGLRSDPTRATTAVVVASGRDPRPEGDGDLVGALVAEMATLRHQARLLTEDNARLARDADAANLLRARSAELRAQVHGLRAELDAITSMETLHERYISDLEQQLDSEQASRSRGFFRLALGADRWMLADPRRRRIHRLGGRGIRALRRAVRR